MKRMLNLLIILLFLLSCPVFAATEPCDPCQLSDGSQPQLTSAERGAEETAIAKKSQDPLGGLIMIPIQNNLNFNAGPQNNKGFFNLMVEPTFPININEDWKLLNHIVIPVNSVPTASGSTDTGLGNVMLTTLVTKNSTSAFTFGAGAGLFTPTQSYANYTNTQTPTGMNAWAAGPAVVGVYKNGPFVGGVLLNQMWSFAGPAPINQLTIQGFSSYNFDYGYSLSYMPLININWKAAPGQQVLFPIGLNVGKVFLVDGKLPIGLSVGGYYNVIRPDNAPESQLRLQLFFVLPESMF
ncbi:MAG: hypothetical protein WCP79_06090 [Bacillota bacterium]